MTFVYTISFDTIGQDKTKINWCDRGRIETKFFFASFLVAAWLFFQRRRQNRIQNLNKLHLPYFCYSFLYYCTTNLICDRHVITILAPRYVLREHVFCSPCFVIKFYPFPVRCLKYTSWKVVTDGITYFTSISSEISSWMSKEMSRTKSSKNFSGHTSTSFSHRLFVCRWT